MSIEPLHRCTGDFDPETAAPMFLRLPMHPPDVIEDAAKSAARMMGRELLVPMTRTPWEATPGDRSFVWQLTGTPALVVKVCATGDSTQVRMWNRSLDLADRLRPIDGIAVPRVRAAGGKPVPWAVFDCAAGSPALLATVRAEDLFALVLGIQKTQVSGFHLRSSWDVDTYARQIIGPLRDLAAAGVISQQVADRTVEVTKEHQRTAKALPAVTAHNDLALYHVFMGDGPTWIIDWESVVRDELRTLDVAHLMVSHGLARPQWAAELAHITLDHGRRELGVDLTSNLVLAQLERAVGKTYDMLRRRHRQSMPAVDALCAVLNGEFMPTGKVVVP
ncbi:MAG TPA: hypothetical protein VFB69_05065 [Candidatus Dormibacteraeota bacterium]|nr:hypothetical protein [Candidatus Dormibacteraeota bacterium]